MTPTYLAYGMALLLHSYVRWALLVAGVTCCCASAHGVLSARSWSPFDERATLMFVALTDVQLVLGLSMYLGLSPIPAAAFAAGIEASLAQPTLGFFGFLHPLLMITAFIVVHAARARSKRAADDRARFRTMAIGAAAWLLIVLVAMPWPWMDYGRPLLRTG